MLIVYCKLCDAKVEGLLEYENHMREHEHDEREIEDA